MLVADVPLGAFVSGGIDSGLIAALMTDLTGGADRHVQHRLRRQRRGERASRGGAGGRAPRQPPPRADAVARPRARRVRPLDRRVRRAVRGPGGVADDAALGLRAARRHGRADRRRRGRGLRRLFELPEARARGALHALARPCDIAAAGARQGAAGGAAQGPAAAFAHRAAAERRYRTIPNVFDVLLHPALFTPQFLAATSTAPDVGDAGGRRVRRGELRALSRSPAPCRHAAVAARRPADQGGPRDDDAFARGAGAVSRPSLRRVLRAPRSCAQDPRRPRTSIC